jgi:hypothetical protein
MLILVVGMSLIGMIYEVPSWQLPIHVLTALQLLSGAWLTTLIIF